MGRNIFLSILNLIAGVCIGILIMFVFFDADPPVQPMDSAPPAPVVSSSPSPGVSTPPQEMVMAASVTSVPDPEENRILLSAAFDVTSALKNRDYQTLSSYVHPTEGVVFTPYSTVDLKANLCFTPSQVAKLKQDTTRYVWGITDGKGEALELTVSEYFDRYVYNADYAQAPMIGIDRIMGSGNALENVFEVFPDSRFVEFYFPGITPEYNGFDWCGLKLVFSEYSGEYKLRAIIHSEWTI